jgi:hypothetical protein
MICGGILNNRGIVFVLRAAGISSGFCFPVHFHVQTIAGPRRLGITAIVIYRTFFVVHIQNIARPLPLGAPVIVVSATFYVELTLHPHAMRMNLRILPLLPQIPLVRFEIVFQQVLALIHVSYFEIVGPGPLGLAFNLVPTVENFVHFDGLSLPDEPARRLIGFGPGVAFDLNRDEFH